MFGPDRPLYSRDEFVSELTSYYEFLTGIFLPPQPSDAHLKADGHINADYIKRFHLNKNDTAVGRIKHIPFIQRDEKDDKEPWMIYEKTASPDFAGDVILGMPSKYAIEGLLELFDGWQEACDGIPEHVGEKPAELLQRDAPDEESWRRYETYTKPGFFSMVKQQWRSGRLIACKRREVAFSTTPDYFVQEVCREEGIFTEDYDRESCIARLFAYRISSALTSEPRSEERGFRCCAHDNEHDGLADQSLQPLGSAPPGTAVWLKAECLDPSPEQELNQPHLNPDWLGTKVF
ncbi:hypothetical protein CT0861_06563 [Colletotrichum tofieldiae]|uniref:Uncharacterized protein n=1 Tax=Colletotrichum tofieldiae TaxID=708197 RepID=A0A166SVD2_9PEZI|nr:hypothetical protein CT0861_06563 [Colletotrichum tofieldiae]